MSQGSAETLADLARRCHSRKAHDLALDLIVFNALDRDRGPVLGNSIMLIEQPFYYNLQNTDIDRLKEVGRPRDVVGEVKGDIDFALLDLDDYHISHREVKESRNSNEGRKYSAGEQIDRFRSTVEYLNNVSDVSWTFESAEVYLDTKVPEIVGRTPEYRGQIAVGEDVGEYWEEEWYRQLDEVVFNGNLGKAEKIRRV